MSKQHELSGPLTMRLPVDVLAEVEKIADACDRSRSWVVVRALKSYLAAEGREILDIAAARQAMDEGKGDDLADVLAEIEPVVNGAAA